jgi:hypothetical protein
MILLKLCLKECKIYGHLNIEYLKIILNYFHGQNMKPIQSHVDEAKTVLGRYAARNGVKLTDQELDDQLQTILKKQKKIH